MKKIFILFTALTVLSVLSTSCNKKLKENMEELEADLADQKSKNETLQGQVNTLNDVLVRTPMTVNFSTTDGDGNTVSFGGSYAFVYGSDQGYSYMVDNEDGTYYIYIWRGADLGTDYSGRISFTYDKNTGTSSNINVRLYGYGDKAQDINNARFSGTTEITHNLTVSAFDFGAGTISFNYSGSTTAAYTNNYYTGNTMTASLSYSGPLAKSLGAI